MDPFDELIRNCEIPRMIKVGQKFPRPVIGDIRAEIRKELGEKGLLCRIKNGDRIAVTAGSRGIANIALITREVINSLKEKGARPFIVPAMGSHGGATAAGQLEVLRSLGITEEEMGAPIKSSMEVVRLGVTATGIPACIDKLAATEADAIVVVNRIKPHTTFRGTYESGLAKMIAVGLGKQVGAEICHSTGTANISNLIESLSGLIIDKANIIFALGIIENAYDETCMVRALPAGDILAGEPTLLRVAWDNIPRIFFDSCDVLIVDEMGKNISGTGMDPNVIGRYTTESIKDEKKFQRIVVLDFTEESGGNANGIGLADICTRKTFEKIDFQKTYSNCLTTKVVFSAKIPMVMNNDRQAIRAGIKTCFDLDHGRIRMIRIKNTLRLDEIYISEALLPEAQENNRIEVLDEKAKEITFNEDGRITAF